MDDKRRLNLEEIKKYELDILCEFDRICKENNLRYGVCGGTLLGAVRHKGFIPWDDDIDVEMPRPDYNKFMEIADAELADYYKFVTPYNDDDTIHAYGKICDLRTTLIEFPEGKRIPTHLYIDIFPIDGLPDNPAKQIKHLKKTKKFMLRLYGFKVAKYKNNENINALRKFFWKSVAAVNCMIPKKKLIKRLDKLVNKYPFDSGKYNGVIVAGYGFREIMPKQVSEFNNYVEFEGKNFRATEKPDYYLTNLYGDYMILPPEENRIHHDMEVYRKEQ